MRIPLASSYYLMDKTCAKISFCCLWKFNRVQTCVTLFFRRKATKCCKLIETTVEHLVVSKNRGTPKSSILIGFSIINHPFWGKTTLFLETPISSFLWVHCAHLCYKRPEVGPFDAVWCRGQMGMNRDEYERRCFVEFNLQIQPKIWDLITLVNGWFFQLRGRFPR